MPFDFQHADGWFDLVWRLCERLEPIIAAAHYAQSFSEQASTEICSGLTALPFWRGLSSGSPLRSASPAWRNLDIESLVDTLTSTNVLNGKLLP
jgi:hypothetical protein